MSKNSYFAKNSKDIESLVKKISNSMKKDMEQSLKQIAKVVRDQWKAFLYENWYMAYTPKVYDRTWETLESIVTTNVIKNGNAYEVTIYYDTDKIRRYTYGHENPDLMPYIVEESTNTPGHEGKPSKAMEKTIQWLETKKEFEKTVYQELKAKGYNIYIK